MRNGWMIVLLGISAAACSEATTSTTGTGGDGGDGGQTTTAPTGGSGGSGTTSTTSTSTPEGGSGGSVTSGGSGGMPVVINEIRAADGDYVELFNTSSAAFDLSDFGLADSEGPGTPKLSEAARFPAGTMIQAGEHLLIVAGQDPADGVGPHDMCLPDGGPATCYYSQWGISDGNGDAIFLLQPDDTVVEEAAYPAAAAPAGSSWGRFPDGTGDFAVTEPTPGDANKLP